MRVKNVTPESFFKEESYYEKTLGMAEDMAKALISLGGQIIGPSLSIIIVLIIHLIYGPIYLFRKLRSR